MFRFVYSTFIEVFKFGFTRSVYLVRLHSDNPVLQCCRKTSRIIWLDIENILNDYIDCLWGTQLKIYINHFDEEIQSLRTDYYIHTHIFDRDRPTTFGEQLLNTLKYLQNKDPNVFHRFH